MRPCYNQIRERRFRLERSALMAIYEYECKECRHEFSNLRPMSSIDDSPSCPTCGGKDTKRKLSMFAVTREAASNAIPLRSNGCCGGGGACGCSAHNRVG